jgi:hypothetical protein
MVNSLKLFCYILGMKASYIGRVQSQRVIPSFASFVTWVQRKVSKCKQSVGILHRVKVKVKKVKLSQRFNWAPLHEGVLENWSISPRILDLGPRWRWVVSFTPQPRYPQGKRFWHTLDRRLGGPQSRSRRGGEEKVPRPYRDSNPRSFSP